MTTLHLATARPPTLRQPVPSSHFTTRRQHMIETRSHVNVTSLVAPPVDPLLDAIAQAYAEGDAPRGEHLLTQALDDDLPWDEVCAAAARGVSVRFGDHGHR